MSSTTTHQHFSKKLNRFPRAAKTTTNVAGALSSSATPNPFGNSAQFLEVAYLDQINQVLPPTVSVANFLPSATDVASNGVTIELWFKAKSSGVLVGQPMAAASDLVGLAPLVYIDSNGLLRTGLFDSTQIALLSPSQNLIASQASNGLITVGPLNTVASPLSVVDGQWHHAALVVQPGNNGTQSLFLDGRLAATGNANGSFGLSFVDSNGNTWDPQTNVAAQLGGSITPQPQTLPSPNFLPYAQGFWGCLNELRSWNVPRNVTEIQQLMDQPLGPNPPIDQGLFCYVGSSQLQAAVQPNAYLSLVPDAPPFDPFTDVTNRIPGYQNFGIFTAIPFTTVAPEVTFQPFQVYSTKITLWQADQLQVSFPGQDANGDNLLGTFSMTLTGAASGELQSMYQVAPGSVFTVTAPLTDCYRFDFTYSTSFNPVTIDNLQFMLIPGPGNTLMQLLLDVLPDQTAYTDPNYPIIETNASDPTNPGGTVPLYPYWPVFTDQTVFPIDPDKFGADDLLTAYINFNNQAAQLSLSGGATFSNFFNLSANNATIYEISDLDTLLQYAYTKVTGNPVPAEVPTAPFESPNDQIYAFIHNANSMRQTLNNFLSSYQSWAQQIINDLTLSNIPFNIANDIYNYQNGLDAALKGPSTGDFIANLLVGSALWGLGAVVGSILFGPEAAVGATIAANFIGSAGANATSEIFGIFFNSTSLKAKLTPVSYSTLEDVAAKVEADTSSAYTTILEILLDPAYVQTLYSNYGLLQALRFINAQPLYDDEQQPKQPGQTNPLTVGTTYATWQALIPSVFTWKPQVLSVRNDLNDTDAVFIMSKPSHFETLPSGSIPSQLGVFEILQDNPDVFYSMLAKIQERQTAAKPSGQFFSICPIFFSTISSSDPDPTVLTAVWVITWSLTDTNGHGMSGVLTASLFGIGDPNVVLTAVDQNNPVVPAGYGWYWQMANGAVTTPFDAFVNWGEGVPSYSPQILVAQLPQQGQLYGAYYQSDQVEYGAAAASDTPPSAIVTLEPNAFDFGGLTIGSTNTLTAVLTNSQKNKLKNITLTNSYPGVFSVSTVPTELQPGETTYINVTFSPNDVGYSDGRITLSAKGEFGPILLTLEFFGTGVAPQPPVSSGTITLQGDPTVWDQVQFYIFDNYSDAIANWNTGTNSVGLAQLDQDGAQCTGLPSGWLAGSSMGSEMFFMIIYFCNDLVLQFGADGAQAGAVVPGASLPPIEAGAGSLSWTGSSAWADGVTYYIFDTCEDALQNWNTGTNAIAGGQLPADGGTVNGLQSGWLAVSGNNQGTIQPFMIVQYYSDLAAMLYAYSAQAVIYFKNPSTN